MRTVYEYTLELTVVRLWPQQMEVDDDAAALVRGVYTHGLSYEGEAVTGAKIVGKYPLVLP